MVRKYLWHILKIIGSLLMLCVLVKTLTFLPVGKIPPLLADKLAYLQTVEQRLERALAAAAETFQLIVWQRQTERKYEILHSQRAAETALLDAVLYENNRLRDALQFQRSYNGRLIPAEIVGRSGDQWFRFVTVSKGLEDGLKDSMMAVDATGGLVGCVYTAAPHSARVILISDPLLNVSCVNERTGEIYVLTGRDFDRLDLKYATVHSDLQAGDRLFTSGYSYRFKKGVPVGSVAAVQLPKNSLTKKVTVKPAANLAGLDILFFVR